LSKNETPGLRYVPEPGMDDKLVDTDAVDERFGERLLGNYSITLLTLREDACRALCNMGTRLNDMFESVSRGETAEDEFLEAVAKLERALAECTT
jgi:hypothetical protein